MFVFAFPLSITQLITLTNDQITVFFNTGDRQVNSVGMGLDSQYNSLSTVYKTSPAAACLCRAGQMRHNPSHNIITVFGTSSSDEYTDKFDLPID